MMRNSGRIKNKNYSYLEVTNIAYNFLSSLNKYELPVDIIEILSSFSNVLVFSYSEWAKRNNMTFSEVTEFAKSEDGCTSFDPKTGRFIVLYNNLIRNSGRIRFTLAHEMGHIILNHFDSKSSVTTICRNNFDFIEDVRAEREADMFAAEFLIPSCFVRYLPDEDIQYLSHTFAVSETTARNSLTRVNRLCRKYGPEMFDIPSSLNLTLGFYKSTISNKEYVEPYSTRMNPNPKLLFNKKTGYYSELI